MKAMIGRIFSVLLLLPIAQVQADSGGVTVTAGSTGAAAKSQQPTVKVFKYTNESGVVSFSDRAPRSTEYQVLHYSCYACNPRSEVDWHNTPLHLQAFDYPITAAARKYGVDPALIRAVIHAESAFKADAMSHKGAQGLMQLMPATAKDLGVENAMSPDQNIRGGVRYLAWLLEQHRGDTLLATAAYNAGPGAVRRHQGVPPFAETQTYVERVKILHERYKNALVAATSPDPVMTTATNLP